VKMAHLDDTNPLERKGTFKLLVIRHAYILPPEKPTGGINARWGGFSTKAE
jgi:hypothetical protein